jgi:acetyl esterase
MTAMTNPRGNLAGRTYLEHGRPVVVLASWRTGTGDRCPRNVWIRRADGSETVRPFRGLRRPPEPSR